MNQEGQRGHLLGFEDKVGAIEEAEVQKATNMVKNIYRRGSGNGRFGTLCRP